VCHLGSRLLGQVQPEPAVAPYYRDAAAYFLWVYFGLSIYFLAHGYGVAIYLYTKLK